MIKTLTRKIKSFSANLTKINNHPVSKATLTSPSEYIPQYCRDTPIDEGWNDSNRLTRIARIISLAG